MTPGWQERPGRLGATPARPPHRLRRAQRRRFANHQRRARTSVASIATRASSWPAQPYCVGSSGAESSRSTAPRYPDEPDRTGVRGGAAGARPILDAVRLTHFRRLMDDEFGAVRAGSIARDHVFSALDGRTVDEALEAGAEPRDVWRAVCREFDVPAERR